MLDWINFCLHTFYPAVKPSVELIYYYYDIRNYKRLLATMYVVIQ